MPTQERFQCTPVGAHLQRRPVAGKLHVSWRTAAEAADCVLDHWFSIRSPVGVFYRREVCAGNIYVWEPF
jgi:hypothetical protein